MIAVTSLGSRQKLSLVLKLLKKVTFYISEFWYLRISYQIVGKMEHFIEFNGYVRMKIWLVTCNYSTSQLTSAQEISDSNCESVFQGC